VLTADELAALIERLPDVVWRYRLVPEPGFEYVSPSVFALTGYTPAEHYADPDLGRRIVHPDDGPVLEETIRAPERRRRVVVRWRHRRGHVFVTEHRLTPVRDGAGRVVALEGVGRAVTGHPARPFELHAGDLVLDLAAHRALVGERVVELTPAEHRLLALLAASDGPVPTGALVARLWGADQPGGERAVQVHVSKVRRKIEDDPARPRRLVTRRGVGYELTR
jgi:DNA-binding response OmpR family regulator